MSCQTVSRHVRFAALLCVVVVASALASVASSPVGGTPAGIAVEPWHQVDGTDGRAYIADEQGRALQFRGMNVKADHPAQVATDELLADAHSRGFNLLRLAIYWDTFEPADDQWDEPYFQEIATVLDRARAHGIWVILDMHQDNFNQKFQGRGFPDWVTDDGGLPFTPHDVWFLNSLEPGLQEAWENLYTRPAFQAAQLDAWSEVVRRFHGADALLGYDLLNEPFGKIREGEPFTDAIERVETTQLGPMYQREADAIRAIDPTHWIFVAPPNQALLGIPTWLPRITGGNVAFFPHYYDEAIESAGYTPGATPVFDPTSISRFAQVITRYPRTYDVPLLIGEWGLAKPEVQAMDPWAQAAMAMMDEIGSGWTAFTGCRGGGYCLWDSAGDDRPAMGRTTAPWARAIAGSPTSFRWDPAARTLLVVFTDSAASGDTELVVPASRVYPDGWEVATSDPDSTWTWAEAPTGDGTGVVSVTTEQTGGAHAICLRPAGTGGDCTVPVAPSTGPGGATPVDGSASFTG